MSARILRGAGPAAALDARTAERTAALRAAGTVPTLAIVRVGARDDDLAYERGAEKRCGKTGVAVRKLAFPEDAAQETLLATMRDLSADSAVHGVLLLRPLPARFRETEICEALCPEKDVDGMTRGSMASLYAGGGPGFAPCTAEGCIELLHYYQVPLAGTRAAVLGRSLVIGKPLAMLLLREDATVTVCHSKTADLPAAARNAELLVAATGRPESIGPACIAPGQTVLDVGICWSEKKNRIVGDVDFDAVSELAGAITPVPGGVGSVTTAVLAAHTAEAAARALRRKSEEGEDET